MIGCCSSAIVVSCPRPLEVPRGNERFRLLVLFDQILIHVDGPAILESRIWNWRGLSTDSTITSESYDPSDCLNSFRTLESTQQIDSSLRECMNEEPRASEAQVGVVEIQYATRGAIYTTQVFFAEDLFGVDLEY